MCIDEFRWGEFFKLNREKQTLNHKSQNNDRNHDNNKDNYNRMSYAKNIVVINALDSRRGWEGLECDDVKEVWIDCELCAENKGKAEQGSKCPNF